MLKISSVLNLMIIYLLWLLLVVLWNFGVPGAAPFEDVVMAIIIGFVAYMLKKNFTESHYSEEK